MTGVVRRPQGHIPLACHVDPDRWFDPTARAASLAACLGCPFRRWCAREALKWEPDWGMWAAVWINGDFDAVAHFFTAIATDTPLPRAHAVDMTNVPDRPSPIPIPGSPTGVSCGPPARSTPKVLVLARASGHCEIMSAGCTLSADTISSRLEDQASGDASTLFAVCRQCANTLEQLDAHMAARVGYRVANSQVARAFPFLWRQTHRVLLGRDGSMRRVEDAAAATVAT